jgi:LysM repeat protein
MDFRSSEPLDTANSLNQSANLGAESMAKEVQTQVANVGQQIGHASLASAPAMPGADALAGGLPVPGAEQGISPLVQMIMKMPGHIGLASSFFEFLGSFFMPQGDLLNGLDLGSIFGGDHMGSLSLGLEHSDIDLSLLPDDAPILSSLGDGVHGLGHNLASFKLNSSLGFSDSTMIGNDPLGFDKFNVSGHITGKPLFEGAGGLRMSGPSLSNNIGNHLANNSRAFSDNLLSGGNQSTLGAPSSNLFAQGSGTSPNITANSLNVGSSTFNGGNAAGSASNASFGGSSMNNSESFQSTIGNMKADSATGSSANISNENLGGLKAKALSLDGKSPAVSDIADAKNLQSPQNLEIKSVEKPQLDNTHADKAKLDKPQADKSHTAKSQTQPGKTHSNPASRTQIAQARPQELGPNPATDTIGQPEMTDAPQTPVETTYTVKTGDSLWDIAKNHLGDGTKWTEIYKLNQNVLGTNPDMIMPGTNLQLPGGTDQIASASGTYTVKAGDNLWDIAKEQLGDGSKWNELYANNHDLIGQNPGVIHPGQELAINNGAAQAQISQATPDFSNANNANLSSASSANTPPAVSHAAPQASAPVTQGNPDLQAAPQQHISSNFDTSNNPMVQPGATPLDTSQPYGSEGRFVSEAPANNSGYQLDKPPVKVETAHAKPDNFMQPAQAADGTSKILKDAAPKSGAVKTNLASDIMSVLKKKS